MAEIPHRYDPAHTAVIVVDVQNDFCSPDGSFARQDNDVTDAVAMVPRLERLLGAARAAAVPVVFIRTLHDETNDSPQWLGRLGTSGELRASSTCRTGTWGAEFFRLAPQPGEPVVVKHRYSAFAGTNLQIVLRTLGVESLMFTGVATEVCVESSLRDGLFAEYYVSLVEDCAASYTRDAHDASVRCVAGNFGTVVTGDYLETLWASA